MLYTDKRSNSKDKQRVPAEPLEAALDQAAFPLGPVRKPLQGSQQPPLTSRGRDQWPSGISGWGELLALLGWPSGLWLLPVPCWPDSAHLD